MGKALGMGCLGLQVLSQVSHWYLFLDTTRDPRPGEENGKGELGQPQCSSTGMEQPSLCQSDA